MAGPSGDKDDSLTVILSDHDSDKLSVTLAEYSSLREEIVRKMDHRSTYRVATLTFTLAVIGVGIERDSQPLLLIVPIIAVLMGSLTIYQTLQISRVSGYIRDFIESNLSATYPNSIGWHSHNQVTKRRGALRFVVKDAPNTAIVIVPSFVSLFLATAYPGPPTWPTVLFVLGTLLTLAFIALYVYLREDL